MTLKQYQFVQEGAALADAIGYKQLDTSPFLFEQLLTSASKDMAKICIDIKIMATYRLLLNEVNNQRCFGVRKADTMELLAFVFVSMDRIIKPRDCFGLLHSLRMKDNEAYIYGMQVKEDQRDKGIGCMLRYWVYGKLNKKGRDMLYSLTNMENEAAVAFKQKLGVKVIETVQGK